jgi:hypothetical protein
MRPNLLFPPGPQEIGTLRIHELVRDYPELGPALEREGVSLGDDGVKCLAEIDAGTDGSEGLLAVLRWRE